MSQLIVERDGRTEVVYEPLPHQRVYHESTATYTLLEGGRGSGKSKCMRFDNYMRALTIPRFRGMILRRTTGELKTSHLNFVPFEAAQLGLPAAAWHATDMLLRFPANGSQVRFGHAEDGDALLKFLSTEAEMVSIDELATFQFEQAMLIQTSLRSPIPGYKPQFKAGTNPIGPGAGWVKRFFIQKNITTDELPDYDPNDVLAIHANASDNTYVDVAHYTKILNSLPSEAMRKALLHGDWDAIEGQAFPEFQATKDGAPWHVIETLPTWKGRPILELKDLEIVRAVDWGYAAGGNPGVCLWIALLPDRTAVVFQEFVFKELLPQDAAAEILDRSRGMRVRYTVCDPSMYQAHEGPSVAEHFARAGVSLVEGDNSRVPGWVALHQWLRETVDDGTGPRPRLRFLKDGCPVTIRSLPEQTINPKKPEDIVTVGVLDDPADCLRYFAMSRASPSRESAPPSPYANLLAEIRRVRRRTTPSWTR